MRAKSLTRTESLKKHWQDPEVRKRRLASAKKAWQGKAALRRKAKMSKSMKAKWGDPAYVAKQSVSFEKIRDKVAASNKRRASDPVYRKHWSDCLVKARKADPEKYINLKKANGERMKRLWADPEWVAKVMATRKRTMYDNPVHLKKLSVGAKRTYANGHKPWNKGKSKTTNKTLAKQAKKMAGKVYGPKHRCCWYRSLIDKRKVQMRSWWEVATAHWYDAKGIRWEYEPRYFHVGLSEEYLGHTYTPDFHLLDSDKWEEVKGLEPDEFVAKFKRFKQRYPAIKITMVRAATLRRRKVLDKHNRPLLPDGTLLRKKHIKAKSANLKK